MDILKIKRGQDIGQRRTPQLMIQITEQIGDIGSLKQFGAFYQEEGKALADALCGSLPGGTVDALLMKLLERRASMLRVPFG